jgi:hypothetical protein
MPAPSTSPLIPLALALLLAPAAGGAADPTGGATLPDGYSSLGENRFKLTKDYEDALKWFRTVYPPAKFPRRGIANQPGIKAVHIRNPVVRPGKWEGMNVYELQGEVRVYVLLAPAEDLPPKPKAKPKKRKR